MTSAEKSLEHLRTLKYDDLFGQTTKQPLSNFKT